MDLKGIKIGDRVESCTKGWLTVSQLLEDIFIAEKNNKGFAFYYNGKYYKEDENPEIIDWKSNAPEIKKHSSEKIDFNPTYSGIKSIRFWDRINNLPGTQRDELYLAAVILQNTEQSVLQLLNDFLLEEKRIYSAQTGHTAFNPCPFCGTANEVQIIKEDSYFICCKNCDIRGPKEQTAEDAVYAWNERGCKNERLS